MISQTELSESELAVGSHSFDNFAMGNFYRAVSREDLYKSADIARIYRLKPRVALAKNRKHRQVAGKLRKPLIRGQSKFNQYPSASH